MRCHSSKCSVLIASRKLENVSSCKYLGVTLQPNTKFDQHIDAGVAEANRTLGFLRRNLRIRASNIKAQAYKSLVRPILEYSCTVWDPVAQDIDRLEAVQRRAARCALNRHQRTASVKLILQELSWPSLEHRRRAARLGVLYKIDSGLAAVKCPFLKQQPQRTRLTHTKRPCRADYRLNSFFPTTVRDWNTLPPETVKAPSSGVFVSRVAKLQ